MQHFKSFCGPRNYIVPHNNLNQNFKIQPTLRFKKFSDACSTRLGQAVRQAVGFPQVKKRSYAIYPWPENYNAFGWN